MQRGIASASKLSQLAPGSYDLVLNGVIIAPTRECLPRPDPAGKLLRRFAPVGANPASVCAHRRNPADDIPSHKGMRLTCLGPVEQAS